MTFRNVRSQFECDALINDDDFSELDDNEGDFFEPMTIEQHSIRPSKFWIIFIFVLYGIISGLAGGIFYAVGVFSADLKVVENYSQTGTNLVAAIAYAGGATPLFFSPLIDDGTGTSHPLVFSRFTWMILTCLLTATGFAASALCVIFHPTPLPITTISFFLFGMGSSLNFTVTMPVAQLNLPEGYFPKYNGLIQVAWALSGMLTAIGYRYVPWDPITKLTSTLLTAAAGWGLALLIVLAFMRRMRFVPRDAVADLTFCQKMEKASRVWFDWQFSSQFLAYLLAFGTSVNFYNNAESIGLSLGGTQRLGELQVSVFFAVALGGRLLASLLSSSPLLHRNGGLFAMLSISFFGLFALHLGAYLLNSPTMMWYWLSLDGLAYGFLWTLMPLTALHFQPRLVSFEAIYSFLNLASAVGPLIFDLISGHLYDQQNLPDTNYCMGPICYQEYMLIASICAFVAFLLLILAHLNCDRALYSGCFRQSKSFSLKKYQQEEDISIFEDILLNEYS